MKAGLKNADAAGGDISDFKVKSVGPFGGRFEYLLNDKVGLGLEGNYTNTTITYVDASQTNAGGVPYAYEISAPRIRVMPRLALHFVKSNDKLDGYWSIAAGYSSMNIQVKTNDPDGLEIPKIVTLIPVAFRTAVGLRYFFTENIGANFEIGFGGGPLLTFGLSGKFGNSGGGHGGRRR